MARLTARNFNSFCKRFSYTIADYDIGLRFNPRRGLIQADAAVTLVPKEYSDQLCFLLADNCRLLRFDYLGISLPCKTAPIASGLNLLTAQLPLRAAQGEKITVNIAYTIELRSRLGSVELVPESHWYPHSLSGQKYTCTLTVEAGSTLRVIGPGEIVAEELSGSMMTTKLVAKTPFDGIHVFAGQFLKTTRPTQPPLIVAYPRKLLNQAKAVGNYCEEILTFFGETLGSTTLPTLTLVLSDEPEAKVHSSYFITSISMATLTQLKEESPGKSWYSHQYKLLAENLAHHWLKEKLAPSHPRERWYLEGLAKYLSWLAVEAKYGKGRREKFMASSRQRLLSSPKIDLYRGAAITGGRLPRWVVERAAWLLRHCHCQGGDKFIPALGALLTQLEDGAPTAAEFFLLLQEQLDCDLCPEYRELCRHHLAIDVHAPRCLETKSEQWILELKLAKSGRLPWPHPLEVEIVLENGSKQRHSFPLQKEPHRIQLPRPAKSLRIDPDLTLLNWAEHTEYNLS